MNRIVPAGSIVYGQLDFYDSVSRARIPGIQVSDLLFKLFFNNSILNWPLQDGSAIFDSSVAAGIVYFNETSLDSTFYSLRFFPDRVGFWRFVFSDMSIGVEIIQEYDIVPAAVFSSAGPSGGLNATFLKP